MEQFTISTFNVRGCRDPLKRDRIKNFVKSHNTSLICLQETHSKDEEEGRKWMGEYNRGDPRVWANDKLWGVSNSYTSRSRGTMVVGDESKIEMIDSKSLLEGRVIFTLFTVKDYDMGSIFLVNVYAPNGKKDRADFFQTLGIEMEAWGKRHNCNHLILTGDFNCILEEVDKNKPCEIDRDPSARKLKEILNRFDLIDTWRRLNPDKKQFTWRQIDGTNINRNVAVRLDRMYISQNLLGNVEKCYIVPCAISDHLPVMLKLRNLNKVKRGKGVWKFNNSLLDCNEFCRQVHSFWNEWVAQKPIGEDILEWWDGGKERIKAIAVKISRQRAKIKNALEKIIIEEHEKAIQDFDSNPTLQNAEKLKQSKANLSRCERENITGLKIRSRVQWSEEGEKSKKFFLNLETYRGKAKAFTKIKKEDGKYTENISEILETQKLFYEKLYTETPTDREMQDSFLDKLDRTLPEDEKNLCEGLINLEEATKALKEMANNKAPGSDGLSKEFYTKFWDLMGKELVEVFNVAYRATQLSESQRLAVITLLYKKGEKADIKNWRPISLLNVDFKILSKCLANRLKKCMDTIVHQDQTCGIKGRTIFENIIFTQDAVFYANKHQKPLAVISVDQAKAFDRLNRTFLFRILKKFGFGDSFIHWIQTIYTDTHSQICTNGHVSEPFLLERGVRQGCPLSPMLFTLAMETLLSAVRKERKIKGFITPDNTEIKTKGYADDTAVYVRDLESVSDTLNLIDRYGLASEAKLNREKTQILLCGTLKDKKPDNSELNYTTDRFKLLGVWIGNTDTSNENWGPVVNKISRLLRMWSQRDLTIQGKTVIVNVMGLSKMWYLATVCTPPEDVLDQIDKEIQNFVWYKGLKRINRELLYTPEKYGGVGCFNVKLKVQSLKIKWLSKIIEGTSCTSFTLGKYFLQNYDKSFKGMNIITTNLKNLRNNNIPTFYQEMVNTWQNLRYDRIVPDRKVLIMEEFLFCNKLITDRGSCLYFTDWIQKGILKIKDIWNVETNCFTTFDDIVHHHNITPSHKHESDFRIIQRSVPLDILSKLLDERRNEEEDRNMMFSLQELYNVQDKETEPKNVYTRLLAITMRNFEIGCRLLSEAGITRNDITQDLNTLSHWWVYINHSDLENKLKQFQWKICHKGLYTGNILHEIDPEVSNICSLCQNEEETLSHIFITCAAAIQFWRWIFHHFNFTTDLNQQFVFVNNYQEMSKLSLLLTVLGKSTIWEMVTIARRQVQLQNNILASLKLNFKYKLQGNMNCLYHRYKHRSEMNTFREEYLIPCQFVHLDANENIRVTVPT